MSRFELPIEGGPPAVVYYTIVNDQVAPLHTEVPQEYSGQGIGYRLAHDAQKLQTFRISCT